MEHFQIPPEFVELIETGLFRPPPEFTEEELSTLERFAIASGMRPEGAGGPPFSLEGRPYLRELYAEERKNPYRRLVIMKAAQMGLTVKLLYRSAWWAADARRRVNVALMFPTLEAVLDLQKSRFRPMFRSSSRMMRIVGDVDSASLVRVGASNLRFRGMRSGIGMDSFPADVLLFDEVRLMDVATIERVFARVSQSHIVDPVTGARGLIELNSTAGFPNMDIHRWFLRSTQKYWATPCPNPACKNHRRGIIMPLRWPDIVGREGSRLYYQCPDCKTEIPDSVLLHHGWYVQQNYDTVDGEPLWEGYQFSQILLGNRYLPELWAAWQRGDNMPEFYNSRLGLPYQDREAIPAPRDVVLACVDPNYRWEDLNRDPYGHLAGEWVSMGVDQRAPEKHVVIMKIGPGGLFDIVHLEVVEASGKAAVEALVNLARRWQVKIAVLDAEPSYDLVVDVGRSLPRGVVWLSDYAESLDPIRWVDVRGKEDIAKTTGEVKYEFRVLLDRYKAMDWALTQFGCRRIRIPGDLEAVTQTRTIGGVRQTFRVFEEFLTHLENIARATIPTYRTLPTGERVLSGEVRRIYRHLAVDPHFAHAYLYAMVGLARRAGTGAVLMGPDPHALRPPPENQLEVVAPEGLRPSDLAKEVARAQTETCGACRYWRPMGGEKGLCGHPQNAHIALSTGAHTPRCALFRRLV